MKIDKFEDIIAWQKSKELVKCVHGVFCDKRDYIFRDQICRAALSVMNNIAEGFERNTDKELARFLYIAKGSCGEVKSMLYVTRELALIDENKFNELVRLADEVSRLIFGFIRSIK